MNNIKLRFKFLFLYFVCVLIPVITVDSLFLSYISWVKKKEQIQNLEYSLDRINYNLTTSIQSALSVSNVLFMDEMLYEFLTEEYSSKSDYYSAYLDYQKQSGVRYVYSMSEIYSIHVYADNEGILEGGPYNKIETISSTPWYAELQENKDGLIIYETTNYKEDVKNLTGSISLIRKLNYNKPSHEIILKLDLDYELLRNRIIKEQENKKVYIFNEEQLVLTTDLEEAKKQNYEIERIMSGDNTISKAIVLLNDEWTVVVATNNIPIWGIVASSGWLLLVLVLINFILPTLIFHIIETSFVQRISLLDKHFYKMEQEIFEEIPMPCGTDEIGSVINHYNIAIVKIKYLIENSEKESEKRRVLEVSKKQAELNALLSQINPHFMYNTLECICMRSLIKGEKETAGIVRNLSVLLREMSSWKQDNIILIKELHFVEVYLELQKYRFDEKISYEIEMEEECREKYIPKLTIVSFVENACVHGIEGAVNPGKISVKVGGEPNGWYVLIQDTGCGMSRERLEKIKHKIASSNFKALYESERTGILNAYFRLKMYYKDQLNFEIISKEDCGTTIIVRIKEK